MALRPRPVPASRRLAWLAIGAAVGILAGNGLARRRSVTFKGIETQQPVTASRVSPQATRTPSPRTRRYRRTAMRKPVQPVSDRRPTRRRRWTSLATVGLLSGGSLLAGFVGLYSDTSSPSDHPSISANLSPTPTAPDSGLQLQLAASISGHYLSCNPVHFRLSIRPLGAYFTGDASWARYFAGGPAPEVHFAVAFETGFADPHNVRISLDSSQFVGTYDRRGHYTELPASTFRDPSKVRNLAARYLSVSRGFEEASGSRSHAVAYTGKVLDWRSHGMPLEVSFDADWAHTRAFGSCYLELPALLGESSYGAQAQTVFALEDKEKINSIPGGEVVSNAETDLQLESGALSVDPRSSPPAEADGTRWECHTDVIHIGSGYNSSAKGDCSGLVVVSASNSDNIRSVLSFVAAALFSLSIQVIYELFRRRSV